MTAAIVLGVAGVRQLRSVGDVSTMIAGELGAAATAAARSRDRSAAERST
ncbi:hypothetical protein [Dactylosporangium salmoneum]